MVSKFGPEKTFHPEEYVTSILFPETTADAPAIELAAETIPSAPPGIIIETFVMGPLPEAFILYENPVKSKATAVPGSICAYAAGVDVYVNVWVQVIVCVTDGVAVCVIVWVSVGVIVSVTDSVCVNVKVSVNVGVKVAVNVLVKV
jgi:hypothetical protein